MIRIKRNRARFRPTIYVGSRLGIDRAVKARGSAPHGKTFAAHRIGRSTLVWIGPIFIHWNRDGFDFGRIFPDRKVG